MHRYILRKCNWFILCNITFYTVSIHSAFQIKKQMQNIVTRLFQCKFFRAKPKERALFWDAHKADCIGDTQYMEMIEECFEQDSAGWWDGWNVSLENWLATALAHNIEMPCDWTASSRTPAAKILSVALTRGIKDTSELIVFLKHNKYKHC